MEQAPAGELLIPGAHLLFLYKVALLQFDLFAVDKQETSPSNL